MVDLHKEGEEDLASAQGILRLTGKHLHERAWIISAMFVGYMTTARRQLLGLMPELRHMNTEAEQRAVTGKALRPWVKDKLEIEWPDHVLTMRRRAPGNKNGRRSSSVQFSLAASN